MTPAPIDPNAILAVLIGILHSVAVYLVANPLVGLLILLALVFASRVDPIVLILVLIFGVAYFVK